MISNAYAMAPTPQGTSPSSGAGYQTIIMIAGVFLIFYFLLIRPQRKEQSRHKKFLSELKKGDEVVTSSGIYGRVAGIADNVVTLEIANQVKVRVTRNSVAGGIQASTSEKQS